MSFLLRTRPWPELRGTDRAEVLRNGISCVCGSGHSKIREGWGDSPRSRGDGRAAVLGGGEGCMVVVDHLLFHITLKVTRDVHEPSPHCSPQELYLGPHLQTPSGLRSSGSSLLARLLMTDALGPRNNTSLFSPSFPHHLPMIHLSSRGIKTSNPQLPGAHSSLSPLPTSQCSPPHNALQLPTHSMEALFLQIWPPPGVGVRGG